MAKVSKFTPETSYNERSGDSAETPSQPLTNHAEEVSDDMAGSKSSKAPAFQFYPTDFLGDPNVIVMSLAERGAYITLLCVCWQQKSLPSDRGKLARLCGVPMSTFQKLWPALEPCFKGSASHPDRIVHPRLDRERRKQSDFRRRQGDNGRLGGRPKKPTETQAFQVGLPKETQAFPVGLQNESQPDASGFQNDKPKKSSSSSLSSSDFSQKEPARAENLMTDEGLTDRAASFLERYKALHVKYRRGAPYMGKMHLDFQEALQLVSVYLDDVRLDKLATVFLNSDDDFSSNGTRTIAKFRSRASWCDERLRERGL